MKTTPRLSCGARRWKNPQLIKNWRRVSAAQPESVCHGQRSNAGVAAAMTQQNQGSGWCMAPSPRVGLFVCVRKRAHNIGVIPRYKPGSHTAPLRR